MERNIQVGLKWHHRKASESYVEVTFHYPEQSQVWHGAFPTEYRRTGIDIRNRDEFVAHLQKAYQSMDPSNRGSWEREQEEYWSSKSPGPTKDLFFNLWHCKWICATCALPDNPNWARRNQDLKEMGYTISTIPSHNCLKCGGRRAKLLMIRLHRGGETGYETISPKVSKEIKRSLGNYDAFEDTIRTKGLVPEHKFPEVRWDEGTRGENPEGMTPERIRRKFQLMNNQRNQQKREVCRNCYQTGQRGFPFGIRFWYDGDQQWPRHIPKRGAAAEDGCYGCGWYDLKAWREALNRYVGDDLN